MASAYQLFQAAERLETLASQLYLLLAERFASQQSARDLFRRLADEEVQHAARIRLLFAQYRNDPKLFEKAVALARDAADPGPLVRETEGMVQELAAGGWGYDLEDALQRLADLEERCAEFHAQFLAAGAHRDVVRFFEELAQQDLEHRRLLSALPVARASL